MTDTKVIKHKTPIEIPAESRRTKADYWDEPPRRLVLEIVKYVRETGKAHMHPAVTYTLAQKGVEIRFLEVFDLDEKFKHDDDNWCVCSACPHDLPQFKNGGILAWFPTEGVMRIIGGDCYRALDPEAHARAMRRYDSDTDRRKDEAYLLRSLPLVPRFIECIVADLSIARALDRVHTKLIGALDLYKIDLHFHLKDGKLRTEERVKQHTHGQGRGKHVVHKGTHATIKGYGFAHPRMERLAPRGVDIRAKFDGIDFAQPLDVLVLEMSERERRIVASKLRDALRDLVAWRKVLETAKLFLGAETGKTLKTWSQLPTSVLPFYFDYSETRLVIGMSGSRNEVIDVPTTAHESLSELPKLGLK